MSASSRPLTCLFWINQSMLAAHDGGMPMYDYTSLSCTQIGEALSEGRASSKVSGVPVRLSPYDCPHSFKLPSVRCGLQVK